MLLPPAVALKAHFTFCLLTVPGTRATRLPTAFTTSNWPTQIHTYRRWLGSEAFNAFSLSVFSSSMPCFCREKNLQPARMPRRVSEQFRLSQRFVCPAPNDSESSSCRFHSWLWTRYKTQTHQSKYHRTRYHTR